MVETYRQFGYSFNKKVSKASVAERLRCILDRSKTI